jgi:cobaltochelatase CobN
VQKGHPDVPVDWMKEQWKLHGIKKSIQLTISGCLGPCDVSNVVSITSGEQTVFLGRLREFSDYAALFQWALASAEAERALPLPDELSERRFDPFRKPDSIAAPLIAEAVQASATNS